jgi:geranylgeranyl transferase type-2 subunit beta
MIYLTRLLDELTRGAARFRPQMRQRHVDFLLRAQNPDGGFSGREGESDLYYTGFALRSLALLGALEGQVAHKAGAFLRSCMNAQTSVVDFLSFLYSSLLLQLVGQVDVLGDAPADWPERVARTLETFRTPDQGYNKSPGAASGSTYHTFLVGLCYQLLGIDWPNRDGLASFVRSRRREDGGFVEVAPMRRSGTNPTAAGIGILHLTLGMDLPAEDVQPAVDFLAQMPSDEGGLRANDRVPLADLLSTFTGCWTLHLLGALDRIDVAAGRRYVENLQRPEGGFLGGLWDEATDVEYTFYGLGSLAILSP